MTTIRKVNILGHGTGLVWCFNSSVCKIVTSQEQKEQKKSDLVVFIFSRCSFSIFEQLQLISDEER